MKQLSVLIIDGETGGRWHRWEETTPVLVRALDEVGLFKVTVRTLPDTGVLSAADLDLTGSDVVLLNYDAPDERWGSDAREAFEGFVSAGGGVVVYHGASNGFPGWDAYNAIIGLGGWRDRDRSAGHYCYVEDDAVVVADEDGPAGSHGRRLPFAVLGREPAHPIMDGLPTPWMHHADELYDRLRGPRESVEAMTVLATALSPEANEGTGRHEPMLMASRYGEGRVFHTTLGHDVMSMSCIGFLTTLQRGVEWAGSGAVTQAVPDSFPTATEVHYRADLLELDPVYAAGLNPIDARR